MTKYREILRLLSNKLKTDDIVQVCKVSKKTVIKVKKRAEELDINWLLNDDMTDEKLETILFPKPAKSASTKRMPDFDHVRKELLRNGVNKKLLWTEYTTEVKAMLNNATVVVHSDNRHPCGLCGLAFRHSVRPDPLCIEFFHHIDLPAAAV